MSTNRMRIGLFGGSFDPIHHGHLILGRDALDALDLERLIFIPATISPFKPGTPPSPAHLRLEMVQAAIAGEPGFECEDFEIGRPGPSYTIDTVEHLRGRFPGAQFYYLIGHDHLAKLPLWRRYEELRHLVEFVVFEREAGLPASGVRALPRRLDISATEIRQRVAAKNSIRYLVPEPVRAIIERDHLYAGA